MLYSHDRLDDWFEAEVKIHEPSLRLFLKDKLPEQMDISDVVQESYARIIKARRKELVKSPKSLLFTIARNVTTDLIRKKYVSKTISLGEEELFDVVSPYEEQKKLQEYSFDDINLLQDAIRRLPPKCRKILLMRNFEDLPLKEIASRMKISVKTVEAQLSIGMKKCKKYFEEKGDK
ncbi:MAG: sigma-70 family RNA polymerase sigma factor [Opitutales bacterium]|nr:sigma-70 family RNA polymerase sigma factor [Opitutales bacterium]